MTVVQRGDLLRKRFELLIRIPGIAQVSPMQWLAEDLPCRPSSQCDDGSHIAALILLMKYLEPQ